MLILVCFWEGSFLEEVNCEISDKIHLTEGTFLKLKWHLKIPNEHDIKLFLMLLILPKEAMWATISSQDMQNNKNLSSRSTHILALKINTWPTCGAQF